MLPLFGQKAEIDQRAIFLDWSPDGDSVLILGGIGNPDLSGGVWLVDAHTHEYQDTDTRQEDYSFQEITSASLSPDGTLMAYTRQNYAQNAGEIWRVSLDGSERQLLIKDSGFRVEDVLWSPDGKHIAFTRWQESTDYHDFALGELWVMNADGSEQRRLSPAVTGYYKRFLPAWSLDSSRIAFIQGSGSGRDLVGLSSNGYVVDIQSGAVRELTSFQNMQVLKPVWLPDGSGMTFVVSQAGSLGQFEPWVVANDGRDLRRIDTSASLVIDSRKSNPIVIWLPTPAAER
jgi:Tol biopolymer transport system component